MAIDAPSAPSSAIPPQNYPVRLSIARPVSQSRITNFPLGVGMVVRAVLLIPQIIVLYFFNLAASVTFFIATFAILFTGHYPRGLFDFYVGYQRWSTNVTAYLYSLHDAYPPFGTDAKPGYPVQLEIDYPDQQSRFLNFPFIGIFVRLLLLIPHIVVLYFMLLAAMIVIFIAHFAILFSGAFPEGMHRFVAGVLRWNVRISAYMVSLTDQYPPFSTQ